MESNAVPEFLLRKSQSKPKIEFWGQRKISTPVIIKPEIKSKFIELLDNPKPNPLQSFYSKVTLTQLAVLCRAISRGQM